MNNLILDILPTIDKVVNHTTQDHDERHEVKQILILKLYDKQSQVKRIHKQGNLGGWMYKVARNIKMDLHRQKKTVSLDTSIPILAEDPPEPRDIDRVKTLDQMLRQLNHVERIWITLYIDSGQSKRELSRRTTICRAKVTERIETILKKWKQLDIYLQQ